MANATKYIIRTVWTRVGLQQFEDDINVLIKKGYEPRGIEVQKAGWFRFICQAMLDLPPAQCDCTCRCCIEIHHEQCDCECDCCVAHAHRDGSYPAPDEDENE